MWDQLSHIFSGVRGGGDGTFCEFCLALYNASTIKCATVAIGQRPLGSKLLVAGNFNANRVGPEVSEKTEYIMGYLEASGLEYMLLHFSSASTPLVLGWKDMEYGTAR